MDISIAHYDSSVLVSISGRVDSYTSPRLSEILHSITGDKSFNIILNFDKVNYVSSAGLRILIDIQKICKREGKGETVLVCVPTRVYETLELAGFTPLFKFFNDDTSAIKYFKGPTEK
jgi:anti-sigma B factor antagonist